MTMHRLSRETKRSHAGWLSAVCVVSVIGCGDSSRSPAISTVATSEGNTRIVASLGQVEIRQPTDPPAIATGTVDEHGRAVLVDCGTCHMTRAANVNARIGTPLTQFHQGLRGPHGNLSCASCHHADDGYRSLRLANGSKLPYSDVMTLCAQCHGPQFRDYQHGAHGGMAGYWDLARGGRKRNNCVDCHDPHAPGYPVVQPAPGPSDRFLPRDVHE